MPAKDIYHDNVKNALIKAQWTITYDPLQLRWGVRDMYVDLGATQLLAAQQQERQIAVEVKSFLGGSEINSLENAVGQYIVYRDVMAKTEPNRTLYLAITEEAFDGIFSEPIGQLIIESNNLNLIVFNSLDEVIKQWLP